MDVLSFSSGAYVSSFLTPIFELGEIGDLGRRTGMAMSITALGALAGPPISGAINTATGGFEVVGYYAGKSFPPCCLEFYLWPKKTGSTIMLAVVLMYVVRHLVLGTLRGKF